MAQPKNLYDLFREQRDQLQQHPSPENWRRLERRLDARRRRRQMKPRYRSLGMVAAIALIAVIAMLFALLFDRQPAPMLSESEPLPRQFEELHVEDSDPVLLEKVAFTRRHQDRLSQPIAEGEPDKKLTVTTHYRSR